jgi:hypothetical protein
VVQILLTLSGVAQWLALRFYLLLVNRDALIRDWGFHFQGSQPLTYSVVNGQWSPTTEAPKLFHYDMMKLIKNRPLNTERLLGLWWNIILPETESINTILLFFCGRTLISPTHVSLFTSNIPSCPLINCTHIFDYLDLVYRKKNIYRLIKAKRRLKGCSKDQEDSCPYVLGNRLLERADRMLYSVNEVACLGNP